MTTLIKN